MGTTSTKNSHTEFSFDDPVLVWLRENTYGNDVMIPTPTGPKKRRYFDFTASGQPFRPIEELIAERVLPMMTNTHAHSNYGAEYISLLYKQAREKVRRALRCNADDVVIFTGQGSTSAINKLIGVMGLRIPDTLQDQYDLMSKIPNDERPLVIRTRMEHHSNDIPWRETIADNEIIPSDGSGRADVKALEALLSRPEYQKRPLKIGTFSAVSNVTGVMNDVRGLAAVMHDHGGYAVFDYAAGAPYLDIDLHPDNDERYRKDAVFISMHKFAGGPQAPGILVCNKQLIRTKAPNEPGGGTVLYTAPWGAPPERDGYHFHANLQNREEGGTPPIVQAIRAGLVWDLKEIVGVDRLAALENHCITKVAKAWKGHPKIRLLGPDPLEVPRLGMMSMVLDNSKLHHNMATRMLSDRYGVQTRGGCMCAHTYGHDLLDIDRSTAERVQSELRKGNLAPKPGWLRASFGPTVSAEDLDVLIEAVIDIAENWEKYAAEYDLDPRSAECFHRNASRQKPDLTLTGPS